MSLHSGLKEGNTGVHQGWNTTTQTEAVVSPTRPVLSNPNIQAIYVRTPTATQQTLNRARPCLVTNSSQMMCSSPSSGTTNHVQLPSPHLIQSSPAKLSSPPTLHAGTQVNNNNSICHATSPLRMSGSPKKECRSPETQVPSQYPPMSTPVASHSVDCQTTSDKDVVLVGSSQQTMFRCPPSIQQKLVGIGQIQKQSLDLSDVIGNPAGQPLTAPTSLKVVGQNKELVKNTVYLLKSPRNAGNAMMAKWDGKQFIPYQASQVDMTGQLHQKIEGHMPNILKTGLAGGGGGLTRKVRQSRPLGGYSTGLHMATGTLRTEKSPTKPPDQQDVPQNVLPNGRLWHHTVKPLTRRPLHPDENSYRDGEKGTDNTEMQVTQQEDGPKVNKAMTHAPLHPNDRIPNVSSADGELPEPDSRAEGKDKIQNVCLYCGFTVFSNERCERCHRLLSYTKKGSTNKRLRTEEPCDRVNNSTIDKRSFYGRKLHEHTNILEGCSKIIVLNSNTQGVSLVAQGSHPPVDGNKATKPKRSAPRVRKRKPIIVTEPVTISSDEEEPQTPNPVNSEVPSLNIPSTVDEVSQDSNSSAKYSDGSKNNCPDEPDDTLPHAPSPKFFKGSSTKRSEMEPEDGTKCQESEKISSDIPDFVQEIIDDENKVRCEIRSFRVGSFRGEPIGLLLVSTKGINCEVEAWSGEVCHIAIKPNEIERVMYCLCNKLTVFFFQTSFECGVRLRKYLLLKPNTDIYFDPCSEQRHFQFIIVIMDYKDFPELERNGVTEILNYYKLQHHPTKSDYLKVISYEMANSVLVSCTPNVDQILNASLRRNTGLPSPSAPSTPFTQHEFNRDSPSPPKIGFVGPIERLIIYPPPPAARGVPVSNEDLYCLNEGEFLNDVIIDFYLKYFYLEKLNDEDRKRTHIFSSFFYKRLTQRERKNLVSDENEDEEDTTPIEKRHSRVRTWTRQVDLFEKDFIIVPINEHSHWFLAIICFPGKLKEEHVMYLPRSKLIPQNTEDTTEKTADSETDTSTGTPKDLAASDQSESNNIQLPNPEQSDSENLPNPEQSDSETQSVQQSASLEPSSSTLTHSVLSINSELSSPEHIGNQRLNSLQVSEMSDKSEEPMETDIQPKEEEQQSVSQSNCDNSEVQDTNHSNDLDVSSQNSVEKTQFDQCAQNNPTVPFPGNEGTVMNPEVQFPCNEGTVRNQEQSTPSAEETKNENATQQNSTQCTPKKPVLREGKEVIGRELTEEEIESEFKKKSWMTGTRRPCILVFDSLVGPSRSNVIRILREYLQVEWKVKKKTDRQFDRDTIKGANPKVPQQDNYSDCGIYVLQYVESFFKEPIMDYSIPMRIPNWFDLNTVGRKRQDIIDLINSLHAEQSKQNKPRR